MWEIGILRGPSPLHWDAPAEARNPILTARDVTDIRAAFVADPFMIRSGQLWYLFFEVLPEASERGEIGLAISRDAIQWEYQRIVLRERFHLSYPHVFAWEGHYYMLPETLDAEEVRLYRSRNFPFDWEFAHALIPGQHADPTIFRHEGHWWMFTCDTPHAHRSLRLYGAPDLEGPWEEHPASPIVADDRSRARPAGRVIIESGRIMRFAQDCVAQYGDRVWAFEITHLSREIYREQPAAPSPIVSSGIRAGWQTGRMHHLDAHLDPAEGWIACADGWGIRENIS